MANAESSGFKDFLQSRISAAARPAKAFLWQHLAHHGLKGQSSKAAHLRSARHSLETTREINTQHHLLSKGRLYPDVASSRGDTMSGWYHMLRSIDTF